MADNNVLALELADKLDANLSPNMSVIAESACRARQLDLLYYAGFSFVFDVTVDQLAHCGTSAVRPQHDAGRARAHVLRPPEPASQQGGQ